MTLDELIGTRRSSKPLSLGDSAEAQVLDTFIDRYLDVRSPFDDFLEAPLSVHEAWVRHGDACGNAAADLRATIRPVLEELFAAAQHEEQRQRGESN